MKNSFSTRSYDSSYGQSPLARQIADVGNQKLLEEAIEKALKED